VCLTDRFRTTEFLFSPIVDGSQGFVVRRGEGKTVIRVIHGFSIGDATTLICARGLLAAGMVQDVKQIILTFRAI